MPQLIIGIIIIAVACVVLKALFLFFIMCSIDFLALIDRMFGAMTANPALSWTISGFIIGTLTYFAFIGSRKLYRPGFKSFAVLLCTGLIVANMFLSNNRPAGGSNAFAGVQQQSAQNGTLISEINLRSSPSKQSKVVAKAVRGAGIVILGTYNDWYRISYNGREGYVKQKYVRLASSSQPANTAPAKPVQPAKLAAPASNVQTAPAKPAVAANQTPDNPSPPINKSVPTVDTGEPPRSKVKFIDSTTDTPIEAGTGKRTPYWIKIAGGRRLDFNAYNQHFTMVMEDGRRYNIWEKSDIKRLAIDGVKQMFYLVNASDKPADVTVTLKGD